MGNIAEDQETVAPEDQETEAPEAEEAEVTTEEPEESAETKDVEVEIVREGTQPQFTQQQLNDTVSKRVKRLNRKVDEINDASNTANTELAIANEKNKILEIALQQAKSVKAAPNPPKADDFDGGTNDPEFIKKQDEYHHSIITSEVARQVSEATINTASTTDINAKSQELQRKQLKHYERANEIGAKDYATTEDKALEILGNEVANHMIDNFDDSHILLYYLGKNPVEAEHLSDLLKSNPIKGVAEIGRLSSELKIKPKTNIAPDPDEEIQGGAPTASEHTQNQLEKLRDQAAKSGKSGDMKKIIDFKKKHKL
jgi:hypothetical protein